jgi:heptosyltransferase-2
MLITPALAGLRRHYPDSHIAALVNPWVGPLLARHPDLNELIVYDPKGRHRSWKARWRFANELHRRGFDMAVLFPNSFHAALLAYLARIPERVGYDTDGRGLLLTHRIPRNKGEGLKHQVEYYLDIIRALGIDVQVQGLSLCLSAADDLYAEQLLAASGIDSSRSLIAVHPGAVKPEKRWSAERFARVGRSLITRYRAGIILLGSPNEQELLQSIRQLIDSPRVLIPEAASLTQTAAVIAHCNLFIGNDSGLMHVAAALGVPIVALFGPGTPATTAPWMDRNLYRIVLAEVSCRPCRQRFFTECSPSPQGKPPCLEAISVEQVLAVVDELWKQLPQQRRAIS